MPWLTLWNRPLCIGKCLSPLLEDGTINLVSLLCFSFCQVCACPPLPSVCRGCLLPRHSCLPQVRLATSRWQYLVQSLKVAATAFPRYKIRRGRGANFDRHTRHRMCGCDPNIPYLLTVVHKVQTTIMHGSEFRSSSNVQCFF